MSVNRPMSVNQQQETTPSPERVSSKSPKVKSSLNDILRRYRTTPVTTLPSSARWRLDTSPGRPHVPPRTVPRPVHAPAVISPTSSLGRLRSSIRTSMDSQPFNFQSSRDVVHKLGTFAPGLSASARLHSSAGSRTRNISVYMVHGDEEPQLYGEVTVNAMHKVSDLKAMVINELDVDTEFDMYKNDVPLSAVDNVKRACDVFANDDDCLVLCVQ